MIDFKNIDKIPRRITKHTVKEGDFYTKSMTSLEKETIANKYEGGSDEEMIVAVIDKILCDDKGEELNLTLAQLKDLPDALFADITKACMGLVVGEKKS
jgi:hypothetical protein